MSFIRKASLILLSIIISSLAASAAGEVDPTFNASTYLNRNMSVAVVAAQPDGKFLIGGNFTVASGIARHGLARFNADGTLDGTFDPPDFFDPTLFPNVGLGGTISAIAVQSNGKILVGGRFNIYGSTYKTFVRLNTNGSLDTSFHNLSAEFTDTETVLRVFVQTDDSIMIMGGFGISTPAPASQICKLDANGVPVPNFTFTGTGGFLRAAALQTDGKFLVSDVGIGRYNFDGGGDGTFQQANSNGTITSIVVQTDGKILIAGTFSTINGFAQGRVARLNADGTVDLSFNTNGTGASGGDVNDIVIAPDGKIFIGGSFMQFNGVARSKVARLNSDGTLDTSFTYSPATSSAIVSDVDRLSDGKILIAGTLGPNAAPETVMRLNADGARDITLAVQITRQNRAREVVQQADGKILVAGEFQLANGAARNSLARFSADGTLDTAFVPYFNSLPVNQIIYAVALQPDGKILVGSHQGIVLRRLNADGSQDTSFATTLPASSIIFDIQIMSNGQVLIAGNFSSGGYMGIARLNANGSTDTTFNPSNPNDVVYKVREQPDGKILIGGEFTVAGMTGRGRIARLDTNGSLDTSFNPPGGANGGVYDFDLQSDGKVVLGGAFTQLNGSSNQVHLGRLNSDGSLDTSFVQNINNNINAIKVQPDGKILVGGVFTAVGGTPRSRLARLHVGGELDLAFNAAATLTVLDISLQSDNKILLAGEFTEVNNTSKITVARLLNAVASVRPLFDFDGDGKADVSVFRPSENKWYVLRSSNLTVQQQVFAIAGDVPVPADYDGDGKTDFAIFRPSSGDWWSLSSINGGHVFAHWGQNGDIPRPSDFDGDGRADYIVFRPSGNFWYRISSANGAASNAAFGLSGDKPVTGDFDGDGKSDKAIFRPSTGDWWYHSSLNGAQLAVHWGISTDIPAPADFDGDGKTDFAVYRPSTGDWYIINSSNFSFTIMHFGIAEDKPVPADYDGDGKADIAVFRPSTGAWYLQQSTAGFWALNWGISTDIPVENAFVP